MINEEKCIFCFLTSEYQYQLRKIAQLQEERFEKILNRYKKLFLTELKIALETNVCSDHLKILQAKKINNIFRKNEKLLGKINIFFDGLISIYTKWISGNAYSAIKELDELLKKFELIESEKYGININNKIFYRGRKTAKNSIFNCYDMFHIPYDKRYLVRNQRYSLSGYPLLYLNASINGVLAELGALETELENYSFSSFYFNKKYNIYSLLNPFKEYLESEYKPKQKLIVKNFSTSQKELTRRLLKLILVSVCSFSKRMQYSELEKLGMSIFYEEYVIPQALTQVLRKNDFNGIYYPSTRINSPDKNGLFSQRFFNLAFFPEYRDRHYDYKLFEELDISTPLSVNSIGYSGDYSLDKLILQIKISKLELSQQIKFLRVLSIYSNLKESIKSENIIEKTLFYNFIYRTLLNLLGEQREL